MASSPRLRAFVSSTFTDLLGHRAYVIEQLRKAGVHVDPMEDWTADSQPPTTFCLERLEGCVLCVLLVAFRRGYVPAEGERSITQMEYDYAIKHGIDVLPFLLDDDALWKAANDERRDDPAVDEWRQQLRSDHGVDLFQHEPHSVPVGPAISRWLAKQWHGVEIPAPAVDETRICGPCISTPRTWRFAAWHVRRNPIGSPSAICTFR